MFQAGVFHIPDISIDAHSKNKKKKKKKAGINATSLQQLGKRSFLCPLYSYLIMHIVCICMSLDVGPTLKSFILSCNNITDKQIQIYMQYNLKVTTCDMCLPSFLYARLKNGTYYVTGYGVRPSVRKLFRFRLTPPTVYIRSSWNLVYS